MKKLMLSVVAMASLAMAGNAVTNMCVKTADGKVVKYDVENVKEVYYEKESSTTPDQGVTVSGTVGNYTYVDLGLSVKWATYNVGATKPTDYGDYFAWGETMPKEDYRYSTYKWCIADTSDRYTKYNTDSDFGTVDNLTVLEAADDAATANWGSAWRMPTDDEIKELIDGCTWKWVENFKGTGVSGRWGISIYNGNTIFLPAAGRDLGSDSYYVGKYYTGTYGLYWSSFLGELLSSEGSELFFSSGCFYGSSYCRYQGQSVRAVTK